MQIFTNQEKDNLVLEVKGRIDAVTSPMLEQECQSWIDKGPQVMVLDMGGVEYISSAGLRTILMLARKLNGTGREIRFAGLRDMVREVFTISGFYSLFPIYPSVTEALGRS